MSRFRNFYSVLLIVGVMLTGFAMQANGQLYRNTKEIRDITRQLENQVDSFRNNLSNQLRRSSIERQDRETLEDNVRDLENEIGDFKVKFDRQTETANDVENVLKVGKTINDFIRYNSINAKTDKDWESILGLMEKLASNYNLYWSWGDSNQADPQYGNQTGNTRYPTGTANYPPTSGSSVSYSLTGTYQLDTARSEKPGDIADRAIRNSNAKDRDNARRDLENKLESPQEITIDVRGQMITIDTSSADRISFVADGREKVQTNAAGERIRVRATLQGQELVVSSFGGNTDYTVTFASIDNGKNMRVTRRFTTDYLRQTVFAESIYQKTGAVAGNGSYDNGDYSTNDNGTYSSSDNGDYSTNDPNNNNNYPTAPGRSGNYVVPDGLIILGTLDTEIDTKVSQNKDPFRMTVTSPNEFRGAVISGYISGINRSGKVSGRSEVTFNFQTIRTSDGRTYDFAGFLQSIRDENGDTIKVDEEGTAKGDSQTNETVKRSGIGAGIGALIGAIAGGAKGAAIGAVIGGGAGAGSVVLQGKDDVKLNAGSQITVRSSSPLR